MGILGITVQQQDMVAHAFNLSTREAEAGRYLEVQTL